MVPTTLEAHEAHTLLLLKEQRQFCVESVFYSQRQFCVESVFTLSAGSVWSLFLLSAIRHTVLSSESIY